MTWCGLAVYGRKDIMRFEMEPSQDLGLQHMLQNGVAALRGSDLGADRTQQVLGGVFEVVADADRGCVSLQHQSLSFARNNSPALERFSLFLSYLGDPQGDLSAKLTEAKDVIERLRANNAVSANERNAVAELLENLLLALRRERAFAPLSAPSEIYYS